MGQQTGRWILFSNWQKVPTDGKIAPKKLVEDFEKEKEELTKKMKEAESKEALPKPNQMNIIQLKKDDSAIAIAKVKNWGIWQPPTISSANKPLLNNYELENTKERNSRAENINQDAFILHSKVKIPINKRPNIPGAYIEDEKKAEEKTIISIKYKKPQLAQKQDNFVENSHQVLDSEEVKDSKEKLKIHEELATINTADFNLKLKEESSPGILSSRKENRNTCSQISQAIKSDNFKNPEEIRRKKLTKPFSPIKALKSLSKGIFKNNWKSIIKPVVTIVSFTSQSKGLSSQIDESALNSLKEVSFKYDIFKKKDIITQNHLKIQKKNIDIILKSEESQSLNEIWNDTFENSHYNNNTYSQEISTSNEGSSKIDKKPNFHQNESVLPQGIIDPSLRFHQVSITGATPKNKFNNLENSQIYFPSNFENIDPRILMEGISEENRSYPSMENIDPRVIREELDLAKTMENPIGGNDQNQVKEMPFCLEEEPLKMEFPCFTSTRKDIECSFRTVHNINEANIDESTYENSINSLSQLAIKKELNQQKTLHPQGKFPGEAYNNSNIEK
ncbi:hypothetical protein O181_064083 [Austropuccinia psidii MF-1]|uniref:Uncharacterized protein n=1 Tax=Austropuccinia psidii MF-1 TaxID=1389203 RepID=A0A9Q3ESU5_9BASI|nr:hypothetical protein [Austropuccinia psidii MF-1]